ncbi:MAG: DUF134 domain-containing protein [Oscillospiraceae bacterium]
MPRPIKCRKVCCLPKNCEFRPIGRVFNAQDFVVISVDEYEAIRLIDHEGFTQEKCGEYMGIARTTVQEIYCSARKKMSIALVDARPLKIDGGEYELCDGSEKICRCGGCKKHRKHIEINKI